MKFQLLFLGLVSSFILSGCTSKEPVVITKIEQVQKECPSPKKKPEPIDYQFRMIELDGVMYYSLTREEALKLGASWISYRSWAETNYKLMLPLPTPDNIDK